MSLHYFCCRNSPEGLPTDPQGMTKLQKGGREHWCSLIFKSERKTVQATADVLVKNDLNRIKALASDAEFDLLFQFSLCSLFTWVLISKVMLQWFFLIIVSNCPHFCIQWFCSTELTTSFRCLKECLRGDLSSTVLLALLF